MVTVVTINIIFVKKKLLKTSISLLFLLFWAPRMQRGKQVFIHINFYGK